MATSVYFNNFPSSQITSEQLLVEDLLIESMQIHGMDVFYLPRTSRDSVDQLFGEDTLKQYLTAYNIEMYLENVTGMEGEGDFISKFGLEIRDEISLLVSRRRFKYTTEAANLIRPREGDLIYVPLVQNFFEITFVEHENDQAMFYTLGRGRGSNVYVYALKCKQFVFSEEIISTGIQQVDEQIRDSYKRVQILLKSGGTGTYANDEIVFQGTTLANASAQAIVHNWNSGSRLLDVYRTQGTFASNTVITGVTSTAAFTSNTTSSVSDSAFDSNAFEDVVDNTIIQNESDSILDWTETNPFGQT
tara:strand:+ start:616 stop:1527 length:912 start_codon:yes stop_codon:yes gene_type:complete